MDRVIIFHFHLFKNAGTSVDEILKANFKEKWVTKEFQYDPYHENVKEVIHWISKEKEMIAFSSHTARLFDPIILEKDYGIKMIPIIFVRHPIVRIHSAYLFERNVQKDLDTLETAIARNTSLKGYCEIRWHLPNDHQCKNFHIHRFSDMFFDEEGALLEKALKALDTLPFVGLVEKFEDSLKKLEQIVKKYFPEFKAFNVFENVQFVQYRSLEERLSKIEKEVGKKFYQKLIKANKEDIEFWEEVFKRYERGDFKITMEDISNET